MKTRLTIAIRARRESMGRQVRQAADDLDVSLRTYQYWESGERVPEVRHWDRLSAWLDVSREELGQMVGALLDGEAA